MVQIKKGSGYMQPDKCPFCNSREPVLAGNEHAFALADKRPVSPGHCLIVARRHVETIFQLSAVE